MSRIGRLPVEIPSGVEVKVEGRTITVKGPKGELSYTVPAPIEFKVEEGRITFTRPSDRPKVRALHGTARAITNNMVIGVTQGFKKELEVRGVGYRAQKKGNTLVLQVGFSHPVEIEIPKESGVEFSLEGNRIILTGIDKHLVGHYAALIRKVRPPEPYKGKGIRYVGEYVRQKAGKAAATGA